jgi:SAM-dependent methyltransferase
MRRDVLELRQFYASDLGRAARAMVGRKVLEAWGDARGLDVLALGYATPFVGALTPAARRVVAAMPAQQGVEVWPGGARNLTTLVCEDGLPFANALFDRILVVHGVEDSPDAVALLREVWRVLAPSGRVIVAVTARNGLWANTEKTPFGHGRPYSRAQLGELLREAELEPSGWTRALYVPPVGWMAGWAEGFEQFGSRLWPAFAGLLLMEAVKQTFAVKPKGHAARVRVRPLLAPAPAPSPSAATPARQAPKFAAPATAAARGPWSLAPDAVALSATSAPDRLDRGT